MKQDIQKNKYEIMTSAPLPPLIGRLAVPTIISMLVTTLYNMVDTYFVGQLNNTSATAAVGVSFSLMTLIQAFGFFFGHGSGNFISRKLGEQNDREASRMASTGFFTALAAGAVIAVLGLVFLKPLCIVLGSTETILPFCEEYLKYILLGAPFMTASLVLNNQLRFQGNAVYAMVGIVSGAVLNVGLDEWLMFKMGLGVSGAAIATVISQFVSFWILVIGVFRSGSVKISIKNVRLEKRYFYEMFRGGVPSLCRQGITTVSTVSLNFMAGIAGADAAIAAFSIISRITMFANSALIGFGQGFQPVCGFNYGAKKYSRVRAAYIFCIKYSFFFLVAISVIVGIFAPQIVTLFRKSDPEVIKIGSLGLRLHCLTFPLNSVIVLSNMMLQSVGKAFRASILAASRNGIFFIPLIFLLGYCFKVFGLQITQPICDALTFCLALPFGNAFLREMESQELK